MKRKNVFSPPLVYKDNFFTIEHTTSFDIPGYLLLFFNENKPFHKQSPEILSSFGHILALTVSSIKEVMQTNYVYCLSFGENLPIPHFHLFPRTEQIKIEYQLDNPSESRKRNISGPDLFAWIMKRKNGSYHNIELFSNRISDKFIEHKK